MTTTTAPPPGVLVGLVGRARCGKDTFAAQLSRSAGFKRYAFADLLKQALRATDPILDASPGGGHVRLGWALEEYGEEGVKARFPEYRRLLQHLGTEGIKAIDANFWITQTLERLDWSYPAVLTDVRFADEACAVASRGGVLVRLIRADQQDTGAHRSETEQDQVNVDFTYLCASPQEVGAAAEDLLRRLARAAAA